MSNATPFVLGLGGGAALWYATKRKSSLSPTPTTSRPQTPAATPRNCAVHVEPDGITIDGARVKVLAVSPAPGDAPSLQPGRLALHGKQVVAGTASTPIVLETVQPAGKGAMRAADWWRGLRETTPVAGS